MRLTVAILITAVLLSMACKADYDIEEVAPPEHMGDECEHEHGEHVESDHEHAEHVESDHEHDVSEISGSDRHVHALGERNRGTGWFFNQPWAATFIWGKMVRDIVILLLLSAAILFVSGYRRKNK